MAQRNCPPWWAFTLRGLLALLFGVLAVAWPGITLLLLVALFAAYAIVSGGVMVAGALQQRERRDWLILLLGLVNIAAGVLAIIYPNLTALALVILMGVNALIVGVLDIVTALRLKAVLPSRWLLGAVGLLSIVFGVLVLVYPGAGALALVWLVSLHAVLVGALLLALGIQRRRADRRPALGKPSGAGAP